MSTDLREREKAVAEGPKKAPEQILKEEIKEGRAAIRRGAGELFLSGLSAGLDIGFSLFLIAVTRTQLDGALPRVVSELLLAAMYAVGFVFVVIGRSELFTEQTTLAVLPVLSGKATLASLGRIWAIIYVANLIGAAIFALLAVLIGPKLGVVEPRVFGEIASSMTNHPGGVIFLSGLLAGWLMGLLSWLVTAARDTISQIALTTIIASVIGFAHLHHVVVGSVEVLAGVLSGQGAGMGDYGRFLLWTTLGNAVGGPLFVAIIKYGHASGAMPEAPKRELFVG
ncbi:MAG TPA: formate/nitrite transporter family protein [Urbifossiella sp.]|nr:formate/nitrite transporter family protein [Urbifossiella sp.]